jgi:CrcB protein
VDYIWIGLGGIVGANARYVIGRWLVDRYGVAFPYGTFVINATGAFLIGILATLLTERLLVDPHWRLLLAVGFLGSYTTFSTYSYDAFVLFARGDWGHAAAYVFGSNGVGLAACIAGVLLARAVGTH